MQGLTHVLAGITIYMYLKGKLKKPYDVILIIILAFLSHSVLDQLARVTYHPSSSQLNDPFWWTFHIIDYSVMIIVIVYYFKKCWYAMGAADFPDLWDWFALRPIADWMLKDPDLAHSLYIHPYIYFIPSVWFAWLPNLNMEPIGVIPEILVDVTLFLLIYIKTKKQKDAIKDKDSLLISEN